MGELTQLREVLGIVLEKLKCRTTLTVRREDQDITCVLGRTVREPDWALWEAIDEMGEPAQVTPNELAILMARADAGENEGAYDE
jgi:hypothetical protein